MRSIYIDCKNGVCADMLISGLRSLGADPEFMPMDEFEEFLHEMSHHLSEYHGLSHNGDSHRHAHDASDEGCGHSHGHSHGNMSSFQFIKGAIRHLPVSLKARDIAEKIYKKIALAEAEVHGATLETVHFHEVGRPRAIYNVITVSLQIAEIVPDRIVCSEVHDGHGTVVCSHGVIPVPVPAVKAMMKDCSYTFVTDDVETEMVTPSGLAMLMGIGAVPGERPIGSVIAKGIGFGGRDTGRGGMEIYLIDEE